MPHEFHPDRISPDSRSTLDAIRRLQSDRAHRDARRTFFVEGVRNVVHAIESGCHIETLVYSEKLLIVPIARRLVRDRCRSGTPTLHVSPEAFRQVSTTLCSDLLRIPMAGVADSLNLAVAESLLLYEVYRSRSVRRARSPRR